MYLLTHLSQIFWYFFRICLMYLSVDTSVNILLYICVDMVFDKSFDISVDILFFFFLLLLPLVVSDLRLSSKNF